MHFIRFSKKIKCLPDTQVRITVVWRLVVLSSKYDIPWQKWLARLTLITWKLFPSENQGRSVYSKVHAFHFFTQNVKKTYAQELTFNEANIFFTALSRTLLNAVCFLFLCKCVGVTDIKIDGTVWCHCLISCSGTSSFSHHYFCTIGINVNKVKDAENFFVLL